MQIAREHQEALGQCVPNEAGVLVRAPYVTLDIAAIESTAERDDGEEAFGKAGTTTERLRRWPTIRTRKGKRGTDPAVQVGPLTRVEGPPGPGAVMRRPGPPLISVELD